MTQPILNEDECSGCGVCVDVCPNEVYDFDGDLCIVANADDCDGCETCVDECAMECIELID